MSINVLIVDDCPVMRMIIRRTINMCGLEDSEVVEADNGREGLDWVNKMYFDLVIIDLNMPVMNGGEMIAQMRINPKTAQIPVLTVTAESNEARIEVIESLTNGYVHKPFSPEILRDKLLKILEKESIIKPGTV